jgi:hypothetical protein
MGRPRSNARVFAAVRGARSKEQGAGRQQFRGWSASVIASADSSAAEHPAINQVNRIGHQDAVGTLVDSAPHAEAGD